MPRVDDARRAHDAHSRGIDAKGPGLYPVHPLERTSLVSGASRSAALALSPGVKTRFNLTGN